MKSDLVGESPTGSDKSLTGSDKSPTSVRTFSWPKTKSDRPLTCRTLFRPKVGYRKSKSDPVGQSPTRSDKSPTGTDKSPTGSDKSPTRSDKSPTSGRTFPRSDFSRSDFGNRSDSGPVKSDICDYRSELDTTRSDVGVEVRPANADI